MFPDKCASTLPLNWEQGASGGDTKDAAIIFIVHCSFQKKKNALFNFAVNLQIGSP